MADSLLDMAKPSGSDRTESTDPSSVQTTAWLDNETAVHLHQYVYIDDVPYVVVGLDGESIGVCEIQGYNTYDGLGLGPRESVTHEQFLDEWTTLTTLDGTPVFAH